ncbi:50S ribosomal protein L31 [Candidatus Bandiella euplotis]|uniref:50S ribosomal protein L31 n=1 Tax=Candidatus Bandiella euplotis TaxID=1664265 RepID=A0ABZ0ULU9_9RICK|nr:50S ribosomal protein L31 [Candidatus Bandiella woodruffii]WPX97120.1 50S ribosomal protein L31 [Candidatus Bandiella woodruffii]
MAKVTNKLDAKSKAELVAQRAKAALHPDYKEVTVEMTDGTKLAMRSTYKNNYLKLDIDPKTHPAWTKEANYVNTKATEVSKFNSKFKGLSFGATKKAEATA